VVWDNNNQIAYSRTTSNTYDNLLARRRGNATFSESIRYNAAGTEVDRTDTITLKDDFDLRGYATRRRSMPMSLALEKQYYELAGTIHYNKRVEKILTDGNKAIGIRLEDGTEHYSSRVISAADGYTTIFKMLEGKYCDDKINEIYEKWPPFPPLIYVGIGVNRTFNDVSVGFRTQL
jgi:hypothetical protein